MNYHFSDQNDQNDRGISSDREKGGRKKFPAHETEIKKSNIFSRPDDPLYMFNPINNIFNVAPIFLLVILMLMRKLHNSLKNV